MTVLHKSFKVLQSFYAVDYQLRPSVEVISSCPKMRGKFPITDGGPCGEADREETHWLPLSASMGENRREFGGSFK
jgi:hypothetical protein